MIEIDVLKASTNKPLGMYYDDTDISEADTELNTPTGSLNDTLVRRFSSTSSSNSFYNNAIKRKPSITPTNGNKNTSELLHKIQALETEISQLVENEINLKSQLLMLKQNQGKQTALDRIHKHIDRFLTNNQQQHKSSKNANDLLGVDLPALFDEPTKDGVTDIGDTTTNDHTCIIAPAAAAIDIPSVLIYRLKATIEHYLSNINVHKEEEKEKMTKRNNKQGEALCTELLSTLNSWQSYQFTAILDQQLEQKKEQDRVTRLLEALHKSLLRNKLMQKDMNLLTKQYKSDLKSITKNQTKQQGMVKENDKRTSLMISHKDCEKTKQILECQIQNLELSLIKCQGERDEYETTLEMVRREMETMLEELEDTRQQRLRYKTQASRLRAGLEAIQKKKKKRHAEHKGDNGDESTEEEEDEEDEAREAIRLMYNEAERQAIDLDRECKRQALTLDSIRKELKLTEEKYQTMKAEKNKQTKMVEQSNRNLTRKIQMLELQLAANSVGPDGISNTTTLKKKDEQAQDQQVEDEDSLYHAKIHALQVALKAAKSDAIVQRTRIYQLERQSMVDPTPYVIRMQDMFKKELIVTTVKMDNNKRLADRIEFEQREWKQQHLVKFQKKFDIDLLQVHREILRLSNRLAEIENEADMANSRHVEEMVLMKHQINVDFENKLQRLMTLQRTKERELQNQLEMLYQKNQTLQDESLILYGRNMMMAHKLGKIA